MHDAITKTITDDFCGAWEEPGETFTGGTARLVARGFLPLGVDPGDQRVREIVLKCRRATTPKETPDA